jgi:hypothetical protein
MTLPFVPPQFSEIGPIDVEEFRFVVQLANAAGSFKMPMDSPLLGGIKLVGEDGSIRKLAHPNVAIHRASVAIRDHYEDDPAGFFAAATRFFAFLMIQRSERMEAWREDSDEPGTTLVNEAVLDAAATQPLNDNGEFAEDEFFSAVERIAAAES